MLRMMGAVLLVGGTGAVGVGQALKLRRRAETLRQLSCAAGALRREITLQSTPMPQLLRELERLSDDPVKRLFSRTAYLLRELSNRSFVLLWQQAAAETLGGILKREELSVVETMGTWLGRYDARQQEDALAKVQALLDTFAQAAAEEARREGRVRTALGLAAGACSAILLL